MIDDRIKMKIMDDVQEVLEKYRFAYNNSKTRQMIKDELYNVLSKYQMDYKVGYDLNIENEQIMFELKV